MERLQSITETISRVGAYVGGGLLLIAVFLVIFDVIARKFFEFSLAGADELSGYAYVISMTWGYVYALHRRAHLRVDVVYMRLPLLARCVLDVVSLLAFSALILLFTYRAYLLLENTVSLGSVAWTPLATPLVIPQVPWVLGFAFFGFCLILLLLRSVRAVAHGDLAMVQEIAHGPAGHHVIDAEVAEARKQEAGKGNGC